MKNKPRFNREFKLEAVQLMKTSEKPVATLARELGVPRNRLYKWRDEVAKKGELEAFRNKRGRPSGQTQLSELERLRRRVAELEEENTILKKADAYFADHPE
jgi:transposase